MAPGTDAGLVNGVSKFGVQRVLAYGTARPDSIFELGSVSKTFTGLMLARMIEHGKAKLEQPVRELLPPDTVVKPNGNEITLLDLVTHRSGLPGLPGNMNLGSQPNPGADYRAADPHPRCDVRPLDVGASDSGCKLRRQFLGMQADFQISKHVIGRRADRSRSRECVQVPRGDGIVAVPVRLNEADQ